MGAIYYDLAQGYVFDAQGMTWTDGGADYTFTFQKTRASDLAIVQDYKIGNSFTLPFNGPDKMLVYNDQFIVMGGAVFDSTYDGSNARGGVFVFDKNDISTILSTSLRLKFTTGNYAAKAYDLDVSETYDCVILLVSSA